MKNWRCIFIQFQTLNDLYDKRTEHGATSPEFSCTLVAKSMATNSKEINLIKQAVLKTLACRF